MIGRVVSLRAIGPAVGPPEIETSAARQSAPGGPTTPGASALSIRDVTTIGSDGRMLLNRLSLDVCAGEIVGLAGTDGNGQQALGDLLSSLVPVTEGSV